MKNFINKILSVNIIGTAVLVICICSCEQFVEITPPQTSLTGKTVFTSDATAISAVVSVYERMMEQTNSFVSGSNSVTILSGLSSDEFRDHSSNNLQVEFYLNQLSASNGLLQIAWTEYYRHIYSANAILEGLATANSVSAPVKEQLEGEVRFIRAFCNFYLVNLFGKVPLVTTTDYKINSTVSRATEAEVYESIIVDLKKAQNLLDEDYVGTERIRPNKLTATAFLARVYLFIKDWENAQLEATKVINTEALYKIEEDLNNVFLFNSKEAIWQLKPVIPQYAVTDAQYLIITSTPRRVSMTSELMGAFETNDQRLNNWVGAQISNGQTYYYPFKYKQRFTESPTAQPNEYLIVFRLAEQYLIRAEARAELDDISGAQQDLNIVRNRSDLPNTSASDRDALLQAIYQENRIEFFSEWAHRWMDLKRNDQANAVLAPVKGSNWQPTDVLYPTPLTEVNLNPNLNP